MSTPVIPPLPTTNANVNGFLLIANAALAELEQLGPITAVVGKEITAQAAQAIAIYNIFHSAFSVVKSSTGTPIDLTKLGQETPV